MKTYKSIFIVIFMMMSVASYAQVQAKCCPDTARLASDEAVGFLNADLAIINANIAHKHGSPYTFTATVVDSSDDCSYCTKIIILLPPEVTYMGAKAVSAGGKIFKVTRCWGMLMIDAGEMCPGQDETKEYVHKINITVKTSDHTAKVPDAGFAIVAYSKVPDFKQENNYWSGGK